MTLRNSAILLGLLGLADLLAIPTMTNNPDTEPVAPTIVVVLTVVVGLASIAAAYGLVKGMIWARPTGIVSRAVDALSTIPALFVGLPTMELVGALVVGVLSLLSLYMLIKIAVPGAKAKTA